MILFFGGGSGNNYVNLYILFIIFLATYHYFATQFPGCHNITCINVTPQGVVEPDPVQSRQLYLQYLDMTDCYGLQDQGLKVIVKNCPQLLHLYLRRCINITG